MKLGMEYSITILIEISKETEKKSGLYLGMRTRMELEMKTRWNLG